MATTLVRKCGRIIRNRGLLSRGPGDCCCFPIPCCATTCYFPVQQRSQSYFEEKSGITAWWEPEGRTLIRNFRMRTTVLADPTNWTEIRQEGGSSHLIVRIDVSEPDCPTFYKLRSGCQFRFHARGYRSDGYVAPGYPELYTLRYQGDEPQLARWYGSFNPGVAEFPLFNFSVDPVYPTQPPILGDCNNNYWDYPIGATGITYAVSQSSGEFTVVGAKTYPAGISCDVKGDGSSLMKINGRNAIPSDFPKGFL